VRTFSLPLGVFLDIEKPEQLALPAADLYRIIEAWCSAVRSAGYPPGVYSSELSAWSKLGPAAPADKVGPLKKLRLFTEVL